MNKSNDPTAGQTINLWYQSVYLGPKNNSYKMALALSLIEHIKNIPIEPKSAQVSISIRSVIETFARHYWDRTSVFKLKESVSDNQIPFVVKTITDYLSANPDLEGVYWKKLNRRDKESMTEMLMSSGKFIINPISRLQSDYKTKSPDGDLKGAGWLYRWDWDAKTIDVSVQHFETIKINPALYETLAIHTWAKFLEKYNSTVNLIKKLNPDEVKRNLQKYHVLMKENAEIFSYSTCFYCEQLITTGTQLDHFVPFSYLLSDDLYNLVPACQTCNSSKSDRVPNESFMIKLMQRNAKFSQTKSLEKIFTEADLKDLTDQLKTARDYALKAGFKNWI